MAKILIVDDERSIRNALKDILEYEQYEINLAEDAESALKLIEQNEYDLILSDIKMPKMDGLELMDEVKKQNPTQTFILITGHGDVDTAVSAIKQGAYDFIQKPLDLNRLLVTVKNALDKTNLIAETKILKTKVSKKYEMIGESASIKQVKEMIDKVAPTDARVLITGSNGTGKEVAARWIHEKSERAMGPFIEVNCAAIPSELIESELFGHEKGAFTSAHKQRKGKFEQAEGGTIFLDEIGDMSLPAQAKVLRALQENKISRVGSDKDINVNVRILAATNKDLKYEIENHRFREDLYHRLSVILIQIPALDERKEDIPLLAEYFLKVICQDSGIPVKKIDKDALNALQKRNWTGNIREFRNVIERMVILGGATITKKDVEMYA
ncbi:MAG: sigma-54-dependent Fis family transcriptional regulator [Bacteroidales bacterium]|nr:sigma-54-dependent Fis family transcriptional regulator [Bacteroidales bacterium]